MEVGVRHAEVDPSSPVAHLRAATRALHTATERRPFPRALARGALSRDDYARHLVGYLGIWADLERRIAHHESSVVRHVWSPQRARVALLEADLADLGVVVSASAVRDALARDPSPPRSEGALLGRLYVLEGSTLGGTVLAPILARSLGLRPEHMRYYHPFGERTRAMWAQMVSLLDEALDDGERLRDAAESARATFQHVGDVLDAALDAPAGLAPESRTPA